MDEQVGRQPQYESFADQFLRHAEDGFFNAYYDRPACLGLLGDVAGKLGTDLNRDILAASLAAAGIQPVRQIAIDEVWSA